MPHLSVAEAAEDLGVSEAKIRRDIDNGILPAYQFGQPIRIDIEDFNTYKEQHRKIPQKANDNKKSKTKHSFAAANKKLKSINKDAEELGLSI